MNIKDESVEWRFKKLSETPTIVEEPKGIIETIDAFVWGRQSWEQKAISNNKEIILNEVLGNGERKRRRTN